MKITDINKEIIKTAELVKVSNDLLDRLGIIKEVEFKEEVIFNKEIKKFGTGSAHLILPEKFIGYEATLIIKKKVEGKQSKAVLKDG